MSDTPVPQTPPARNEPKPLGRIRRATNWLWGYDFFISYQWKSGGTYAVALAQRLRDKGYEVFLDRADYAGGDDWRSIGELALRNTLRLVLIATRGAVTESEPVKEEVEIFTARNRHIIPIEFGDTLAGLDATNCPLMEHIEPSKLRIREELANLTKGPVEQTVADLMKSAGILRKRRLRIAATWLAVSGLLMFAGLASLSAWKSARSLDGEARAKRTAQSEARRASAQREAGLARMALQDDPELAILHAVKSIRTSRDRGGSVLPECEHALRDALNAQGGRSLRGHTERITELAVSPDSHRIATGSEDGTVRLWDSRSDAPTRNMLPPLRHGSEVRAVFFDPEGKRLITADETNLYAWDPQAPDPSVTRQTLIAGPLKRIYHSKSGRWIITADEQGTALWAMGPGGSPTPPARLDESEVLALKFSKDESRLAINFGGTIRVWELGDEAKELKIHVVPPEPNQLRRFRLMTLSADGQRLAASTSGGNMLVWNLESLEEPPLAILHPPFGKLLIRGSWLHSIALSPDARWLASAAGDGSVRLWDFKNLDSPALGEIHRGELRTSRLSLGLARLTFAMDGTWLVLYGTASQTFAWRMRESAPPDMRALPTTNRIEESPDGQWLMISSAESGLRAMRIPGQPVPNFDSATRLAGSGSHPDLYSISSDSRLLVTAEDAVARVWDLGNLSHSSSCSPLLLSRGGIPESPRPTTSSDRRWLAAAGSDGIVRVVDLTAASVPLVPIHLGKHFQKISGMHYHPDKRRLIVIEKSAITIWEPAVDSSRPVITLELPIAEEEKEEIRTFALSKDGRFMAMTHGVRGWLWKFESKDAAASRVQLEDLPEATTELFFTADSGVLAIPCTTSHGDERWSTSVRLINTSSPTETRTLALDKEPTDDVGYHISPNGRWLLREAKETASLWDLNERKCHDLKLETTGSRSIAFAENDRWLLVGELEPPAEDSPGTDHPPATWLWDLNEPGKHRGFPGYLSNSESTGDLSEANRLSPDGKWLVTTAPGSQIYLWDLSSVSPLKIMLSGHNTDVMGVAFDAGSKHLATWDSKRLQVWALGKASARRIISVEGETSAPLFSPDGEIFSCISRAPTATDNGNRESRRYWRLLPGSTLVTGVVLSGAGRSIADDCFFTPDHAWYAQAVGDSIGIWPLRNDDLLKIAEITAGRNFTRAEWNLYYRGEPEALVFPELPRGEAGER